MAGNSKKTQPDHPSQQPFGALLAQFVGTSGDGLDDFNSAGLSISPALLTESRQSKSRRSKRDDTFADFDFPNEGSGLNLDDIANIDDDYDERFDSMIELAFKEDEDVTLRNNLISMGRKYAIKGLQEDEEVSEVHRSFVRQENALRMLMEEMSVDAKALDSDIDQMRTMRTRNYKAMADMVSAKVSMHQARLSAIKEMSAIQKSKYDITLKLKKDAAGESADSGMAATAALQKLLSVGRKNLISQEVISSGVSDVFEPENDAGVSYAAIDAMHEMSDIPEAVTDGDKWIQYEDRGVEYILDLAEDGTRKIYAEDRDGNLVEDFPMPSNPDRLQFQINDVSGTAVDDLQRTYRLRRNGVDVARPMVVEED